MSTFKVICTAGVVRWDSKNEGLSHQEICYVWLKMLLVSDLLHGGGVSASGPAAGATTNQEGGRGVTMKGTPLFIRTQSAQALTDN